MNTHLERFVAIGDIHTEDETLARILAFASTLSIDAVLSVGDIVDGHGDFERCVELLEQHAVECVRGNHERWLVTDSDIALPDLTPRGDISVRAREFCRGLPAQRFYTTPAGRLQLCHGLGRNDMASLMPDDEGYGLEQNLDVFRLTRDGEQRYVVHGHTHRRMARTIEGVTFLNPGTLYRGQDPGFALVDLACGEARFFDVASEIREASVLRIPG